MKRFGQIWKSQIRFSDSFAISIQNFEPEKPHSLLPMLHLNAPNWEAQIPVFYFITQSKFRIKQGKSAQL
jgi:hypothetical protein